MPAFATASPLTPASLDAIIADLQLRTVEAIDLYNAARVAHWNVRGMSFGPLHDLFGKVANGLSDHADTLAERAVALGGIVDADSRAIAEGSTLTEYPKDLSNGEDHCRALFAMMREYVANLYASAKDIDDAGDPMTFDVITGVVLDVEKLAWMIGAHVDDKTPERG
jgi:starvation-inducible DNA-binding protein